MPTEDEKDPPAGVDEDALRRIVAEVLAEKDPPKEPKGEPSQGVRFRTDRELEDFTEGIVRRAMEELREKDPPKDPPKPKPDEDPEGDPGKTPEGEENKPTRLDLRATIHRLIFGGDG